MRTPEELARMFRAQGRKVTSQRMCIFRALYGDATHPTAESVFAAARAHMETLSLKTVYQTLHELAAMGEIALLDVGTGTTRFDPNVESCHHHLVCRRCGRVRDLYAEFPVMSVPAGADQGFEVDRAEIVFRGVCGPCRADPDSTVVPPDVVPSDVVPSDVVPSDVVPSGVAPPGAEPARFAATSFVPTSRPASYQPSKEKVTSRG